MIADKINRKLKKLRLQPIHVFLFHQTSEQFDESTMKPGDWTDIAVFKQNIIKLKEKYSFISLAEAYAKIKKDRIRVGKYAVLTSDDGWNSLREILPWLAEMNVPVTLFINPGYMDGGHFREKDSEKYLTSEDITSMYEISPSISLGSHGWFHKRSTDFTIPEFRTDVERSLSVLQRIKGFVPFWAYTYGAFDECTNGVLKDCGLIPVLIDGGVNFDDTNCIHRELIDGLSL